MDLDFKPFLNVITDLKTELINGSTREQLLQEGPIRCRYSPSYPSDTIDHWEELVDHAFRYYNDTKSLEEDVGSSGVTLGVKNHFKIPRDPETCWQLYYSSINFSNKERIQAECLSILNQLSPSTEMNNPTKGLVVGNVQSGKTMNMAGVISMAMDYNWNVIIILTGTIEALRKQTQRRLKKDLRTTKNVHDPLYREIRWPEISSEGGYTETIKLDSDEDSRVYITLCLKHADNLRKLLKHLNKNKEVKSHMRVLVIDDEADQASVNTSELTDKEDLRGRRAINRLVVNLVSGYDQNNEPAGPYQAMNYVAYTATPYANLLSENELRGEDDDKEDAQLFTNLYPKDFIKLLTPAKEYFGPTQIFGYPPQSLPGLGIIDTSEDTFRVIREMVSEDSTVLPRGLKDAIAWFVCCVVIKRRWVKNQPISMLINPDMSTDIHARIESNIELYLRNEKDDILSRCRTVYSDQTKRIDPERFRKRMGSINYDGVAVDEDGNLTVPYCDESTVINDYPPFDEIEQGIRDLLSTDPEPYQIDDDKEIHYHSGIHICIDNSRGNDVPRLYYPDKDDLDERGLPYPDPAPAIIVIGGNTLSRGLTIEGLVSTYFSRKVSQADVSMQMCRWFGFRKGYELLPRMWMSENILRKYRKTVDIDESVRKFMRENYDRYTPAEMVIMIKNYPGLRATSKSKSRGAVEVGSDHTGLIKETGVFFTDEGILDTNMLLTRSFLGGRIYSKCKFMKDSPSLWTTIPSSEVMDYLESYESPLTKNDEDGMTIIDLSAIKNTLAKSNVKEWVVVVGNPSGSPRSWISLNGVEIGLAGRSASPESPDDKVIITSRLINPRDQYADCDPAVFVNPCTDELRRDWTFKDFDNHVYDKYMIREGCNRLDYPVLIIYGISGSKLDNKSMGLGLEKDVIGLCVQMPGKKNVLGSATMLSLKVSSETEKA